MRFLPLLAVLALSGCANEGGPTGLRDRLLDVRCSTAPRGEHCLAIVGTECGVATYQVDVLPEDDLYAVLLTRMDEAANERFRRVTECVDAGIGNPDQCGCVVDAVMGGCALVESDVFGECGL